MMTGTYIVFNEVRFASSCGRLPMACTRHALQGSSLHDRDAAGVSRMLPRISGVHVSSLLPSSFVSPCKPIIVKLDNTRILSMGVQQRLAFPPTDQSRHKHSWAAHSAVTPPVLLQVMPVQLHAVEASVQPCMLFSWLRSFQLVTAFFSDRSNNPALPAPALLSSSRRSCRQRVLAADTVAKQQTASRQFQS